MSSRSKVLYIGVTNNLTRRVHEHKMKVAPGFTQRYNVTRLVYFESTHDIQAAIRREKHIKGWLRAKKKALISSTKPKWEDLTIEWFRYKGSLEKPNLRRGSF